LTESNTTSDIGRLDVQVINDFVSSTKSTSRPSEYHKWTDKDRYTIGKYATVAVKKFNTEFPALKESTVRTFKKRYYEEIRKSKEKLEESKKIQKYRRKTERPYLLGSLDEMVQQHLRSLSKKGSVINTTLANATAKVLIIKYTLT